MSLERAWADLADKIKGEVLSSAPRGRPGFQAVVTAVGTPDANGRRFASISWQGQSIANVLCNADLTLAVGNLVAVELYDTDPVIAFRLTTS